MVPIMKKTLDENKSKPIKQKSNAKKISKKKLSEIQDSSENNIWEDGWKDWNTK